MILIGGGVVAIIFFIVFFVWAGKNSPTDASSTSNWREIKQDLFSAWISPLLAILGTFLALGYFISLPNYSVYLMMALACLAVGLSVAALSFALVSR